MLLRDKELIDLVQEFVKLKGANKVKIIYLKNFEADTTLPQYLGVLGKGFKIHPYGFSLNSPPGEKGAIEFIFE